MSEEKVEFKILEAKLIGSNTVVFRLEDGTMIKVKVDIERAAVAIDFKNPDGTPHYNIGTGVRLTIIPKDKKFYIPKSKLKSGSSKERTLKPI